MKTWCTALLIAVLAATADADTVQLLDGRTLAGIARTESGSMIVRTRHGDLRIPECEVLSVVPGRTALHEYDERVAALDGSPTAYEVFELALWARQEGLIRYVHHLLTWTLDIAPDHPEARRLLGFVRYEGRWILSGEKDRQIAEAESARRKCLSSREEGRTRQTRTLETTPYTLGIPMSRTMPARGYGGSGGYSIWQGVGPVRNAVNLVP